MSETLLEALRNRYVAGEIDVEDFEAETAAVLEMEDRRWPILVFKTYWGEWSFSVCTGQGLATGYAWCEYEAWRKARAVPLLAATEVPA